MAKKTYHEPKPICEKLQYLIGVPSEYLDNYEKLNKGMQAQVRKLCNLRSTIIANYNAINDEYREGKTLKGIKTTARLVGDIEKFGITIGEYDSLSKQVIEINEHINSRMVNLSAGFGDIPEQWIREIFMMPYGDTSDGVANAVRRYRQFKNFFPYQKYINWSFAEMPEETKTKNIFGNDDEFIALINSVHTNKAEKLQSFVGTSEPVVVVVDCENSDAQRLYNALLPIKDLVNKVIFIDDEHTNALWAEFAKDFENLKVNVEYEQIKRLKDQKSLVDLKMVAKTCQEFYQNKINKFIFASSDSDIWALISSLPDAEILILAETSKCSDILTEALTQKSIQTIFLEDIADDSGELRDRLMYQTMAEGMSQFYIDIRRIAFASAQKLNLYLDREVIEKYAEEMMHDIHISKDEENKRIYASIK